MLRRELDNQLGIASSLNSLGQLAGQVGAYEEAKELLEESLVLCRELGHRHHIASILTNLGSVTDTLGLYTEARKLYTEALTLFRDLDHKESVADGLSAIAELLSKTNNHEASVQLFAASQSLYKHLEVPLNPSVKAEIEQSLKSIREAMGKDFSTLWKTGKQLSMNEAVELALSSSQTST